MNKLKSLCVILGLLVAATTVKADSFIKTVNSKKKTVTIFLTNTTGKKLEVFTSVDNKKWVGPVVLNWNKNSTMWTEINQGKIKFYKMEIVK